MFLLFFIFSLSAYVSLFAVFSEVQSCSCHVGFHPWRPAALRHAGGGVQTEGSYLQQSACADHIRLATGTGARGAATGEAELRSEADRSD